jgi:CheY-like chemotaxis protein
MPPVPRIVVVDARYDVAYIVRGALALLNRQYVLVEVPTAENALGEIRQASTDLVVAAYKIPGEMNGIDLARRINHESLGTPVIVLAEEGDPQLDETAIADEPFQYYMRPVAEAFLRGLRIGLDGEAAVVEERPETHPEIDLGPVPPIDINRIHSLVDDLMRDVGAMCVILADRTGRVVIERGATGYIDREKLSVILGPLFARSADIGSLIGGDAWTMHYYNGERLDVYSLSLGLHYVMSLVFEGSNRRALAFVIRYGRPAADQMIEMMGEAAYVTRKAEPLPPAPKEPEPPKEPAKPATRKQKKEQEAEEIQALLEQTATETALEPIADFDPEKLFAQPIDENLADTMFDPEALSELAESLGAGEGERVGYDEAIDMGIIDE